MRAFVTLLLCLAGIASAQQAGSGSDNGFTVVRADKDAYSQPAPVLAYRESETSCRAAATSSAAGSSAAKYGSNEIGRTIPAEIL